MPVKGRMKVRRPCKSCGCRLRLLKPDGSIKRCPVCHLRATVAWETRSSRNRLLSQIYKNQHQIRRRQGAL